MEERRGPDALEPGVRSHAGAATTPREPIEPEAEPASAAMRTLLDEHRARPRPDQGPRPGDSGSVPGGADRARSPDSDPAPMVQVPASLLTRVISTIAEVRAEVGALQADALVAERSVPDSPGDGRHEEACMVVLSMALNGAPQSEAEEYLSRHFPGEDSGAVAGEIYKRMAGMLHG